MPLLGWVVVEDLCRRTIPNTAPMAIATLGIVLGFIDDGAMPWGAIVLTGLFVLVLAAMHGWGWLGGGDVKLAGALLLMAGVERAGLFVLTTALAGGALALVYLAGSVAARRLRLVRRLLRRAGPRRGRGIAVRVLIEEAHRIATRHSLPYGMALAVGGLTVLSHPS